MRQLAQLHGQAGWHAHAFPLSVDGLEVVASLVLLADHQSGRRPGWPPWVALSTGTAGSLAANVATAGPGVISRIIAGWPALALLIAVKLLSGVLTRPAASPPRSAVDPRGADLSRPAIPAAAGVPTVPLRGSASNRSGTDPPERSRLGRRDGLAQCEVGSSPDAGLGPVKSLPPGIADLLPAARAARDALKQDGRPLTRDALGVRLRASGSPVRNSRLTSLLHALRRKTATVPRTSRPPPRTPPL